MSHVLRKAARHPRPTCRYVLWSLVAAGILSTANDADAFCRSTSCRPTASKPCRTDDNGCSLDGAALFWPSSCIGYATNKLGTADLDPVETREVIRKAFFAWSDVQCADGTFAAMTFQEREPISCKKSEYNKKGPNVNVILFQDSYWKYRGVDATLAKTSVTYNDETGEIYDADIEINTANNTMTITDDPWEVEYDLQSILTHEVGHFIGIAHSSAPRAVMYASYSPGSMSQRTLNADDIEAVCAIYPANGARQCNPEPRNGFSPTCDEPESSGLCAVKPTPTTSSLGLVGIFVGAGFVAANTRRRRRMNSSQQRNSSAAAG